MEGHQSHSDVPALSAAVVAVAVSMFVVPGPYSLLGAIVALSLALVILSYVGANERTAFQSAALSSVMGLLAIQLGGFLIEWARATDPHSFLSTGNPRNVCGATQCAPDEMSRVLNLDAMFIWAASGVLFYTADLLIQRRRGDRRPR